MKQPLQLSPSEKWPSRRQEDLRGERRMRGVAMRDKSLTKAIQGLVTKVTLRNTNFNDQNKRFFSIDLSALQLVFFNNKYHFQT